jgi:S1-C subfamily serine protease
MKGSAVNIGDGFYVTAYHVVETNVKTGNPVMTLTNDQGQKTLGLIRYAKPDYDIAVLFTLDTHFTKQMFLNCDTLSVGSEVKTIGNPDLFDFLEFDGNISGKKFPFAYWKDVYPVAGTIIPGMSGGALVDDTGRLAGVNIGYRPFQLSKTVLSEDSSYVNISFAVPSDIVCQMMDGRADYLIYQLVAKK